MPPTLPPVATPRPGPEDFRQLRTEGYYYVDKKAFIAEWIEHKEPVLLLPRPRRFGKTVNLSTLRYWLEKSDEDRSWLFEGLAISRAAPEILAHQGRYPVIFLSLKDVKELDFSSAVGRIRDLVGRLYEEHAAHLHSPRLDATSRERFEAYRRGAVDNTQLQSALRWLSDWLRAHHGVSTVILVDEQVSLRDLEREPGRVWSILLTAGYLKVTGVRYEHGQAVAELAIPNVEVGHVWRRSFSGWLQDATGSEAQVRLLHRAV